MAWSIPASSMSSSVPATRARAWASSPPTCSEALLQAPARCRRAAAARPRTGGQSRSASASFAGRPACASTWAAAPRATPPTRPLPVSAATRASPSTWVATSSSAGTRERPGSWWSSIRSATTTSAFALASGAIATSGLARRIWRTPSGFAHHLIDPSTGEPAWTGVVQATAVAPTAVQAEALAKAALLTGPDAGLRLLERGGGVLVLDDGTVRLAGPAAQRCPERGMTSRTTRPSICSGSPAARSASSRSCSCRCRSGVGLALAGRFGRRPGLPAQLKRAARVARAGGPDRDRHPRPAAARRLLPAPRPGRDRAAVRAREPAGLDGPRASSAAGSPRSSA